MELRQYAIYLLIMALTTYVIRALPFVLVKEKTKNVFVKSFLTYIPYAVLSAMTIPAVFYAPDHVIAAVFAVVVAVILAYKNKGLMLTAVFAAVTVFCVEIGMRFF